MVGCTALLSVVGKQPQCTIVWLVALQLSVGKQESLLPCHALCNPAQNTPTDDHYRPAGDEEGGDNTLFKLKIKTKRKTRKL